MSKNHQFRVACIQMTTGTKISENLSTLETRFQEAKEKGATALVVEKDISIDKPYFLVKDCYKFLDQLAKYQRDIFTGKVIPLRGKTIIIKFISIGNMDIPIIACIIDIIINWF